MTIVAIILAWFVVLVLTLAFIRGAVEGWGDEG